MLGLLGEIKARGRVGFGVAVRGKVSRVGFGPLYGYLELELFGLVLI